LSFETQEGAIVTALVVNGAVTPTPVSTSTWNDAVPVRSMLPPETVDPSTTIGAAPPWYV
jgi:hypothetical protein